MRTSAAMPLMCRLLRATCRLFGAWPRWFSAPVAANQLIAGRCFCPSVQRDQRSQQLRFDGMQFAGAVVSHQPVHRVQGVRHIGALVPVERFQLLPVFRLCMTRVRGWPAAFSSAQARGAASPAKTGATTAPNPNCNSLRLFNTLHLRRETRGASDPSPPSRLTPQRFSGIRSSFTVGFAQSAGSSLLPSRRRRSGIVSCPGPAKAVQ